jgi:MoxR-like ATPase
VRALLDNRFHCSFQDVKDVVIPAMRHRVILNFEGEAEGVTTDAVLANVIENVPTQVADLVGAR